MNVKNTIKITVFALSIFFLASSVWYSPVLFKGHVHSTPGVTLARNLSQTGIYGAENDLNVLLSSNLVREQAHISASGNKLTQMIYAGIFRTWGEFSENELVLLSLAVHSLALIIFALVVLYLFGFKISLIFSLIYILLPFNWQSTNDVGMYEFALLFFAFFFLFYLFGLNRKRSYLYLVPAGFFLGLTCLARETFFLFLPFFFVYLWWKKPKRYLLYVFIPLLILLSCLWLPNIFGVEGRGNSYLLLFTTKTSEKLKSAESGFYSHLFPDPYTYHFEKEEFLENYQNQLNNPATSFLTKTGLIKAAANNGIRAASPLERVEAGLVLLSNHTARFFSLEDMGGPFIFLLMLLGIYSLRQRNKYLFGLSLGWVFSVVFLLSFVALAGRRHLIDFNWILALWIALGLTMLCNILGQHFHFSQVKSKTLLVVMVSATLYGLVVANHAAWDRLFEGSLENALRMRVYSQKIEELNIPDEDVIAVPDTNYYRLNYLINKSLVVFREETIGDLLNNGKLSFAFETFNVKYIVGYSFSLTEEITTKTQIINVADDAVELPKIEISPAKVWLLNLIK